MRKAEDIISSNFDNIYVMQFFCDDDCNIIKYNKYAKEYIESCSSFKIEELPLKYALSEKMLEAMKLHTACSDTFFVNKDNNAAEHLKLNHSERYYAFHADYEPVEGKETGEVLHYFVAKDITDQMTASLEAQSYSQKFHDVMRNLGVAHMNFYPDDLTLDIVGGRDNYSQLRIQLTDPMRSILHPEDLSKGLSFFKRVAKNKTKKHSTILRIYSKLLMEYRHYSIVLNPMRMPNGQVSKFTGFAVDVTERIELLKKQDAKSNVRLTKLEKEKTNVEKSKNQMDQMLSVMGHDLRSPLSTILGFSELMVNVDSEREREEMFGYIQKSVGQMMVLVNSILESTRLDSGTIKFNITKFDIMELVEEVYVAHKPLFKDISVQFVYEPSNEALEISSDRVRVAEILNNYLSNALKYTKTGTITLSCEIEDDGCYLHVIDTGTGIAKKDCVKVFNRYEMLGSEVAGTGLGLYICRELAHGLGGKVGCVSDKGKGCDFWLWLPVAK